MNNADLVKMYRYLHDKIHGSVGDFAQWTLDNANSRNSRLNTIYDENNELIAEMADLSVAPGTMAWRWMLELDRMPWVYCHDCGELSTVMDRLEEAVEGACACWDDPPPWVGPYGDMGYDPADTIPPEGWTPADDEALRDFCTFDDEVVRHPFWNANTPEMLAEVVE